VNLRQRPAAVWALPLAVLALGLALLATDAGGFASSARNLLFDSFERAHPRPYDAMAAAPLRIRVLEPDSASLVRFGPWPWPHAVLARLVRELRDAGTAAVVFTFPLDTPDAGSPKNLLPEIPAGPDYDSVRATIAALPSADDALAAELRQLKAVTGFSLGKSAVSGPAPHLKAAVGFSGTAWPYAHVASFPSATPALPTIESASAGVGALNLPKGSDGIVHRIPLVFAVGEKIAPSLAAETLRVTLDMRALTFASDEGASSVFGDRAGVANVNVASHAVPTAPDGSLLIAWSGPNERRFISPAALDSGTIAKGALANTVVYLGAPGDLVRVPVGTETAAEAEAEALENVLTGSVLRRPPSAPMTELACTAVLGLALVFLLARLGAIWGTGVAVLGMVFAVGGAFRLFTANHVLLDVAGPGLVLALVAAAGALAKLYEIGLTRLRLRSAFADALPFAAVEKIARSPALLKLDGESRTVTYLACGIRGFADLAAGFRDDPTSFTRLVQRVLTPLMDETLKHGGAIDRLTTDGFTAFWNAPLDDPEHAIHACETASRMTERMAHVNDEITRERRHDGIPLPPAEIGIGIATGPAIAGGFSAYGRTAYSVTGDCAVVATRVQALSAQYGPAVIVSDSTRKACERGFAFLEVDYIAAGAHEEPIKLFAMLGNPVVRASPKFRALTTFHEHIFQSLRTQQWQKTRDLIEQCRKLSGASQKVYDLHLARIGYFEANPPGPDWDGAFRPILR